MLISQETLAQMVAIHERADPYSPWGMGKASYESSAQRATHPGAQRALYLQAARHWRGVMAQRLTLGERTLAARAYKFARMAVSAARYA